VIPVSDGIDTTTTRHRWEVSGMETETNTKAGPKIHFT